jgi:hypothetical protein
MENKCVIYGASLIGKIETIRVLCAKYHTVYIQKEHDAIREILPNANICFFTGEQPSYPVFNLDEIVFEIPEDFRIAPIYYTASGLLGDLILQLSIVCEMFYKTGRKGIVTLSEEMERYNRGLESTYNDIQSIVKAQPYIEDLRISKPTKCDINLSKWRNSPLLFKTNWYDLFLQEYNVHFGKHKWIYTKNAARWNTKIVIHISQYRFPKNLCYQNIIQQFGIENVVFLNMEETDLNYFTKRTGISIPTIYKPGSFEELCEIINSCKLFVGALSMPLTIAHATYANRIVGLCGDPNDDIMNLGLYKYMPNIVFEV